MKATVYIHGGDYDCSELVRMCYRAVGVLPYGSYMWTGNEIELLTDNGFARRSLSAPEQGDVLWRDGHTEIYLGNGMQGGARHGDYPGGLDGRQGDQDGTEVTRSAYRASDWSVLLRYEGAATVDGIPAAIAAAIVADHIIDHNAHGYSQPNRKGDGTIEAVTITWTPPEPPKPIKANLTVTASEETNVRSTPDLAAKPVGTIKPGKSVRCDALLFDGKTVWGHYLYKQKDRYVSVGKQHEWVVVK